MKTDLLKQLLDAKRQKNARSGSSPMSNAKDNAHNRIADKRPAKKSAGRGR